MEKIVKSIYTDKCFVIPMADVQHIEKQYYNYDSADGKIKSGGLSGIIVITKHTRWDMEVDTWANNIWLPTESALKFLDTWYFYRHEIDNRKK